MKIRLSLTAIAVSGLLLGAPAVYAQENPGSVTRLAESLGQSIDRQHENTFAENIRQRTDPALRQESLERLRLMLESPTSEDHLLQSLRILQQSSTAKFDKKPFLDLVTPMLDADNDQIRATALRATTPG